VLALRQQSAGIHVAPLTRLGIKHTLDEHVTHYITTRLWDNSLQVDMSLHKPDQKPNPL